MNHQPFYRCIDFAEPIPETKADKAKIELLAKKSVPRGQHDTVEF